eukprot:CAMPEP_0119037604 /NCGR_PEP_ID=MMETSP1177-20130426/6057_1 /TAXON_ID=2985 /ORGANISM="Ochromonas sp, Strain CCMP1899" /LENGTH=1390 /DNA_ID=CAMNT_0006999107 /DNA_START=105 /DNA_END=4274 /DNA_ORIENTATION=+
MTDFDKSDWLSALEDLGYSDQQQTNNHGIDENAVSIEEDSASESPPLILNELGFFGVYLDGAVESTDDVNVKIGDGVDDIEEDSMPNWPQGLGVSAFDNNKTIDLLSLNETQNTYETELGSAKQETFESEGVENESKGVEKISMDLIDMITAEATAACDAPLTSTVFKAPDPATSTFPKDVHRKKTSSSRSSLSSSLKVYYSLASTFLLAQLKASGDLVLYEYALAALINMKETSTCMMVSASILSGRLIDKVLELPFVDAIGNCASETALFMADRSSQLSDKYVSAITTNDPESRHIQRLLLAREAGWGAVHKQSCFLSSLPWHQRQLLKITRNLDRKIEKAIASLKSSASVFKAPDIKDLNFEDDKTKIENDTEERLFRGGVAGLHHLLTDSMEEGDDEAQYALSRWFTPPAFKEKNHCYVCSRTFSLSLFRHHCRGCGRSCCTIHSSQRRPLLRFGIGLGTPVRVCDNCAIMVDDETRRDGLTWRMMRVEAYLSSNIDKNSTSTAKKDEKGQKVEINHNKSNHKIIDDKDEEDLDDEDGLDDYLIPYDDEYSDRGVDKVIRVAECSLQVVKSTVSLNYPTKLALDSIDILKRYGMSGLAGVLLRKDFIEAVETLKRISGIDHMFSLSLHELTACIYYKLAIDRGLRGCDPEGEMMAHRVGIDRSKQEPISKAYSMKHAENYKEHSEEQFKEHSKEHSVHSSSTHSHKDIHDPHKSTENAQNLCVDDDGDAQNPNWDPSEGSESVNSSTYVRAGNNIDRDNGSNVCGEVSDYEVNEAIRLAPLALSVIYEESPVNMQRLALYQGWTTILISSLSKPEQPAYAIFATREGRKQVVLAVRGTSSIHDIVTDIRATPENFPPSKEEINEILNLNTCGDVHDAFDGGHPDGETSDNGWKDFDSWLLVNKHEEEEQDEGSYACGGMARAALWLLGEIGPALLRLHREGYEVLFTGHSMGGVVAALVCHLMRIHTEDNIHENNDKQKENNDKKNGNNDKKNENNLKNSKNSKDSKSFCCVTYGCPSSVCTRLAECMNRYVTCVVLHDDIISRITPESIRGLLRELLVFREQVFRHLRQDWADVIKRARDLWSPRNRNTVSTDKSSTMSVNTVSNDKSSTMNVNTGSTDKSLTMNVNTVSNDKSFLSNGNTVISDNDISNDDGKINNDTILKNNDDNVNENKTETFNIHYTVEDQLMEKNILLLKNHSIKRDNHNTHDNDNDNNNDDNDNDDNDNKDASVKNSKKNSPSVIGIKHTFDYIHKSILNKNTNKDVSTDKYVRDDTKDVSTDSKHVNTKDGRTNHKEVRMDIKGRNNGNVSTDNCTYEGVSSAVEGEEKNGSGNDNNNDDNDDNNHNNDNNDDNDVNNNNNNTDNGEEKNGSGEGDTVILDDTDADVW